jgi:hypothetical protein
MLGLFGIVVVSTSVALAQNPVSLNQPSTRAGCFRPRAALVPTLTVNGAGFVFGSVVQWNGTAFATTLVSGWQVTVSVPAEDIATAGTASITDESISGGRDVERRLSFNHDPSGKAKEVL